MHDTAPPTTKRATFRRLSESTSEAWAHIHAVDRVVDAAFPERVVALLRALDDAGTALPVSRLVHSLQTATLAAEAGESEPYVVAALLHDIGEPISPHNHAEVAAAILAPYVDEATLFIVRHHPIFQGYHFWHVMGGDRHARDVWRGHPHFEATARFCERYDERAFDANGPYRSLETFVPLLNRVLAKPRDGYDANTVSLWRRGLRRAWRLVRPATGD